MATRPFALLPLALASSLLAACGDNYYPPVPDAAPGSGGVDAAAGGAIDAGGGADLDAAPTGAALVWSEDLPNPYVIPAPGDDPDFGGVALDYLLQYTVTLPTNNVPASLLRRTVCSDPADSDETCDETSSEAVDGQGGYRWGLDPSQYDVGFNVFTHTLELVQDGDVIATAVLRFEVTATHE